MQYEVEQKFRIDDPKATESRLSQLGATFQPSIEQSDVYFAHPARDFAKTDEALRIRRIGQRNFVTYKGPKIGKATKTRRELELPLQDGDIAAEQFALLLDALGFQKVAEVRKQRRPGKLIWQDRTVEVALDTVAQVGQFVEIEILVDQGDVEKTKECLLSLSEKLGLHSEERQSYLEMLLQSR